MELFLNKGLRVAADTSASFARRQQCEQTSHFTNVTDALKTGTNDALVGLNHPLFVPKYQQHSPELPFQVKSLKSLLLSVCIKHRRLLNSW